MPWLQPLNLGMLVLNLPSPSDGDEKQEKLLSNQTLFLTNEQQGNATSVGCCLSRECSHGVPGAAGKAASPFGSSHSYSSRNTPQIPFILFYFCYFGSFSAPNQLELVKGLHGSTSQVIYSRVL